MASILKIWLRFPGDAEESYTSLPCGPETLCSDLCSRISAGVKKKRGFSIEVGGEEARNESFDTNVWQVQGRTSGLVLKSSQKVISQLAAQQDKDLELVFAPLNSASAAATSSAPSSKYPVGHCMYSAAAWCPAQAFVTYLVASDQLRVAEGEAFSRRCFEEKILSLADCVEALSDGDLEQLKESIGPQKHARVAATVAQVRGGNNPDDLKAFLRPVPRKGVRMRSVIIQDPHQVMAQVYEAPRASVVADERNQLKRAVSPSPSPSASPEPSASGPQRLPPPIPASFASPTAAASSSSSSSPPIVSSPSPPPVIAALSDRSAEAVESIVSSAPPVVFVTPSSASVPTKPAGPPPPPPPPPPAKAAPGKSIELVVDEGVIVERVLEYPTLQFDVTKINERGRRQQRILRLTNTQIQNIKDGDNISSRHSYDEVFCVTLQDQETLVISYLESHDYVYVSPIALQIVECINERICKKREKQKQTLSANLNAIAQKFQEKMFKKEQAAKEKEKSASSASLSSKISLFSNNDAASTTASSSSSNSSLNDLEKDMAMLNASTPSSSDDKSLETSPEKAAPPAATTTGSSTLSPPAPPSRAPPPLIGRIPSKSALKLQQLFGNTHEQRLTNAIDTILLEGNSDAGKARSRFVKNMSNLEKNPLTMLSVIRAFMDSLRNHVVNKRAEEIKKVLGAANTTGGASLLDEEDLPSRIERSVEGVIIAPGYQRILATLHKQFQKENDALNEKLAQLRQKVGCDQSFYSIPNDHQNVSNWSSAIEEINDIDKKLLPVEKLQCLLNTAKAIYTTFNNDRTTRAKLAGFISGAGPAQQKGQYFLSADDFFPIFCFVISQSSLTSLESTKQFMLGLCEKGALNGEGGYYLTVLEAASEYLKGLDATKPPSKP